MPNKIIAFLTKNLIWKATALVLAAILWVIAINIEDPIETRQFFPVRVGLENMDTLSRLGLVILNQEDIERSFVTASLWANRRLLNQLESADLRAYVDMGSEIFEHFGRAGESISARVHLSLPDFAEANVMIRNTIPHTLTLLLDSLDTREFPITVVKIGDPLTGHVSMIPVVTPSAVEITGPKTILDTIMNVRAEVNLDSVFEDYFVSVPLGVYSENNINITDRVSLSMQNAEILVRINRHAQIQVAVPALTGSLPSGHVVTNIQVEPAYIDIVGREEDLAGITQIIMDPIDISGFSPGANVVLLDARDPLRPTPLSIQNSRPHEVFVTVTVEREEILEIVVPMGSIEVAGEPPEGFEVTFPESLVLRVIGVGRIVNGMDAAAITAAIDITGLEEGSHYVPVSLILPDRIRRADDEVYLRVDITAAEDAAHPVAILNPNEDDDDEVSVPPTF